ncbi:MAG: hypothetical protein PHV21_06750, partial [Synergistaceae bacterium]|nr:hypothetical protein [Synergistaceae bacterium]
MPFSGFILYISDKESGVKGFSDDVKKGNLPGLFSNRGNVFSSNPLFDGVSCYRMPQGASRAGSTTPGSCRADKRTALHETEGRFFM